MDGHPAPTSPRAAPPTPQEIHRKLGAPSAVPPLAPALASSPDHADLPPALARTRSSSTRRHSHTSSSAGGGGGLSSADEDDLAPSSPSRTPAAALPLSAISEASDAARDSGTDSDASSLAPEPRRPTTTATVLGSAVDRLRSATAAAGVPSRISDDVALKSGYLMKKGERRKAWKKRWFVLRGGQLAMYKNDKEYQLLRLIPLSDIHTCAPIELKKHAHAFGIVTPRRTYYIKASSQAEVADWCAHVDRAKAESKASSTLTSGTESPGEITPQGARTPTAAIPIPARVPSSSLVHVSPPTPDNPASAATSGLHSFTTSTSPSPPQAFSPTSVSGTSFTSTTTTSSSTGPGTRVPPNSFAHAGLGGLGLHNSDGHALELGGVDAGLERLARSESYTSSSSHDDRHLALPSGAQGGGYFGARPQSAPLARSPSAPAGPVLPASPGALVSSSEDDDDAEGEAEAEDDLVGLRFAPLASPSSRAPPAPAASATATGGGFGDPNKVILSGYLMKQGKRKNWRKRWFVLMSGRLVYSRSHMDPRVHRQIPLARILDAIEYTPPSPQPSRRALGSVSASSGPLSPPLGGLQSPIDLTAGGGGPRPGMDHTFKVITPKRTYLLCAPTEEDEIAWLAALQCLVARKATTTAAAAAAAAAAAPAPATPRQQQQQQSQALPMSPRRESSSAGLAPPVTGSSGTGTLAVHGRQRSVTDAARAAVRDGVNSFRERPTPAPAHHDPPPGDRGVRV